MDFFGVLYVHFMLLAGNHPPYTNDVPFMPVLAAIDAPGSILGWPPVVLAGST